jgi:membrane protein
VLLGLGTPLNRIYDTEETRTFWNRLFTSFLVSVIVIACVYAAILDVYLTRLLHPSPVLAVLLFIGRWAGALLMLLLAIGAIVRLAPSKKLPAEWVSVGALLSALSWIGASLLYGAYVSVVSYTSLYGFLALIVVLLAYLYYSSVSFLFGIVVDSLLRDEIKKSKRRRKR